ncbi:MAG: arginine deiminase family protein [Chloroflexi bacterium]|nr:arginine deiminase family protein [Chloroflexota bacterium]
MKTHALVRLPGASFARAISSTAAAPDVALAQAQHAEYRQALAAAGLTVEILPADERYPDGCFVEDTAVIAGGTAVICRPGAASRRGEEATVAQFLAGRFPLARIVRPGTLEGGDVIVAADRVLVGRSARTNAAGIAQLVVALADLSGLAPPPVYAVPVAGCLHLKTAATYIGHNTVLAIATYADHPAFAGLDALAVLDEEAYAADALAVDDTIILPAGYPRTTSMLRARGFTVLPVPVSEFAKADGGVTCLSLIW